jgi:hypothetical protein
MTQEQLDILCVNTQCDLADQGVVLVRLIKSGDISAQAYAANHFALHGHMKAIKDFSIESGELTDAELFLAQQNITWLVNNPKRWT